MRRRFVQVKADDGRWMLIEREGATPRRDGPHRQVMPDTKEFVSPVDGKLVSGRAARRAHNALHDVEDVGSDPSLLRERVPTEVGGMVDDLQRAYQELGYG